MCSFCRKRHELGFSYCPAYGNRCEFCGKYNHDQRACWLKYPNFCRFRKGKIDRKSFSTERSSDNYTKILTQENVQVENIVQHLAKEGSESSSSKCEDLEDLKENQDFRELKSAESSKTKAEICENKSSDAPNESYDEGKEWWRELDDKEKHAYQILEEKVRAMQMIESHEDLNWFESSKVKNYYTSQGGSLLTYFILKYKRVEKLEDERKSAFLERNFW